MRVYYAHARREGIPPGQRYIISEAPRIVHEAVFAAVSLYVISRIKRHSGGRPLLIFLHLRFFIFPFFS